MPEEIQWPTKRIVLDTNIVMDMLHFQDKRTTWLKNAITRRHVLCFSDAACFAELERVAAYPEFQLDNARQDALLAHYAGFIVKCDVGTGQAPILPRCRDADDQKFLELAARCKAEMLVTRDKQLLRLARYRHNPPPFAIVTAEEAEKLVQLSAEYPASTV